MTWSPHAFMDHTADVHESAPIWHFACILADVKIEADVSIGAKAEIGRGSWIGAGARIGSGAFLPPNSCIGERVFIGPNVTFTDDPTPRVPREGDPPYTPLPPVVDPEANIGAGAVICPGVRIGARACIAAGAIVTRDVPADGFVRCEPARERDRGPLAEAWNG